MGKDTPHATEPLLTDEGFLKTMSQWTRDMAEAEFLFSPILPKSSANPMQWKCYR